MKTAHYVVWGLVLLLLIVHQDNWLWNNDTLVFGFIPIGLFFHACISVAASITWFLAVQFTWPLDLHDDAAIAKAAESSASSVAASKETGE